MQAQIFLLYYDRPVMVCEAVQSVLAQSSGDWILEFIDDGSPRSGREAVQVDDPRIRWWNTRRERSVGGLMTELMCGSGADISFILCDDDWLDPYYVQNCLDWRKINRTIAHAFSSVQLEFGPLPVSWQGFASSLSATCPYNQWKCDISPHLAIEGCQYVWDRGCAVGRGITFSDEVSCLDSRFMYDMYRLLGKCVRMPRLGQHKRLHGGQLSRGGVGVCGERLVVQEAMNQAMFWHNRGAWGVGLRVLEGLLGVVEDADVLMLAGLLAGQGDVGVALGYLERVCACGYPEVVQRAEQVAGVYRSSGVQVLRPFSAVERYPGGLADRLKESVA